MAGLYSRPCCWKLAWLCPWLLAVAALAADTFSLATYNLEQYADFPGGSRRPKTATAKASIQTFIKGLNPDVLALQEIGGTNALLELRASLQAQGQFFPHWEWTPGFDTNLHVAVLSKFPIIARRSHSNLSYLLHGRRLHVSRGFAEVDIQARPNYTFTLITVHLKSRRQSTVADESEMREQEAILLRQIIDERLQANPRLNLALVGDFNDLYSSPSLRLITGRGKTKLLDTRPVERNGDSSEAVDPQNGPRNISWTYYYAKEDTYSRIDYIFLSPGMAKEFQPGGAYVYAQPGWGQASDHRPLIATFSTLDK